MILKKIRMENFRSYINQEVDLPPGTNLFEGDIGSGKSTILYAIEFALFGMGDMRGDSLLKAGKDKGFVELSFDIAGKEYTIRRAISRKGEGISQTEGFILCDNRKIELSPTELRAKILEILNFNESLKTRSSSVIFRYAIFTPQEEMKEILRLRPEERLQTLRKAFGLEDYKTAKDNAKTVADEIRSRIRFIEGEVSDMDSLERQLNENRESMASCEERLSGLGVRKARAENELFSVQEEIKGLEGKRIEIEKISSEIPLLESELRSRKRELSNSIADTESLTKDILAYEKKIDELVSQEVPTSTAEEARRESASAQKEMSEKTEKMIELRSRATNYKELMEKKVCPTCGTSIDAADYQEKVNSLLGECSELSKKAGELREKSESLQSLARRIDEFERNRSESKRMISESDKLRSRLSAGNEKIKELGNRIVFLEKEIPVKIKLADANMEILEKIKNGEARKRDAEERMRSIISESSQLSGRIKTIEETNARLGKMLAEKTEQKKKKETLTQNYLWITEYFMPCLDRIEKQVLASINSDFNSSFQKWFSMLMEGSEINVRIDESFTPMVEQNGYEMPIDSLSGGEKTSVAFSYRLALNMMVRKVTSSMESNLLILDEPTDGFSKEQLFKVRDVLNELKCDQVILVSHERELESFVDKIFVVEKKGGVSKIIEK